MAIPINEDPYNTPPLLFYDEPYDETPPTPHYRPQSIDEICKLTKFNRREVQVMYRAFKQGCPTGTVMLQQFQEIFAQFFPSGNAKRYASYVFNTFDKDRDEVISFEEFVVGLSIISRGTDREKFGWVFDLYDINRQGCIGQSELLLVINSIYELIGKNAEPPFNRNTVIEHVVAVFKKLNKPMSSKISKQQFIDLCTNDRLLCDSLNSFNTVLRARKCLCEGGRRGDKDEENTITVQQWQ
uniref:EF-hand domain-containing protein n=1 Tax=Steinernema glaseri TaxID=37863 RepID=A0A1I7YCQ9_9BILA